MKRFVTLVLVFCMMLSVNTVAFAQSEPDGWAVNEVSYPAAEFLKAAMGDIDYSKGITREEFAVVVLYIYGNLSGMELPEMSVDNPFTDCNSPLVVTAYGLGLVKGVSETEFNPDALITREQVCVMLTRVAEGLYEGFNIEYLRNYLPELESFTDGDAVSDYAVDSVKLCVMAGLVKGTDEGKINPQGNCTVQEALIIAKRAMNIEF